MELLLNEQRKTSVTSLFDARVPQLPAVQAGDTLDLAVGVVDEIPPEQAFDSRLFSPQNLTGATFRVAIGTAEQGSVVTTLSTASASAGIGVTTVQTGQASPPKNHQARVIITGDVYLGTWTFSTAAGQSSPIGVSDTTAQIRRAIEGIVGVGTGNVSVVPEDVKTYLITFINDLAGTLISGIAVDGTNLVAIPEKSGSLPLAGDAIDALLAISDPIVVALEVQKQVSAGPWEKILNRNLLLKSAIIDTDATDTTPPSSVDIAAAIATFVGSGSLVTVNSTGTTDLAPATAFFQWSQTIVAQAGGGAYTQKFTLDNARAVNGARFYVALEIAASANPALEFYSDSTGSGLLFTISGDPDNAQYPTLAFVFESGAWVFDGIMK